MINSRAAMLLLCIPILNLTTFAVAQPAAPPAEAPTAAADQSLKVLSWNIWHGGREDGEQVGPGRVVEVIRDSGADLVAVQETYGSGQRLASELGFHWQPRGTNVSILSRFPIVEDVSVGGEFNCVGAIVELADGHRVAVYSIWLPYADDIWQPEVRRAASDADLQAACAPSAETLQQLLAAIRQRLAGDKYRDVSVVVAGDFNCMSHLDYTHVAAEQYGRVIAWPTSRLMADAGFRDAFRETNVVVDRAADATWSPRFANHEQDRIDFVYYQSPRLRAVAARNIREHQQQFPSDHAAVLATFDVLPAGHPAPEPPQPLSVASYNIRRGLGFDGKADLDRTVAALGRIDADIVGLQEVDLRVDRSGRVNQPAELGRQLERHAAFAPFMDYGGGKYGLAILSRFPIRQVHEVPLPKGNEPRTALAVEVVLPNNQVIMAVNIHFDWVRDDTFRYRQAELLAAYLEGLTMPYVLVGDFNDTPPSRTLQLMRIVSTEAEKQGPQTNTYPADKPSKQIDYLFVGPQARWNILKTEVVDEPVASDHRPVRAALQLLPPTANN